MVFVVDEREKSENAFMLETKMEEESEGERGEDDAVAGDAGTANLPP
jgi:hypothetical protein